MSAAHSTENFRESPRFPGYRFGDQGTVQSRRVKGHHDMLASKWHDLTPSLGKRGYHVVRLSVNRETMLRLVHCLVLEAFSGPCPEGMQCRHLDGDRTNNVLSNLVWGTAKENAADRDRHGTTARHQGTKHYNAKLTDTQVYKIRSKIRSHHSYKAIAKEFGIAYSTVRSIASGQTWKHLL